MPMFMDSPSGERPPRLKRTLGPCMATALVVGSGVYVLMWWRGRDTSQHAIPEASARAQVEAAHCRERVVA